MKKIVLSLVVLSCFLNAKAQKFLPSPIHPDSSYLPLFFEKRFQHPYLDDYVEKVKKFDIEDYKEYVRKKRLNRRTDPRCNRTFIDDSLTSENEINRFSITSYPYLHHYFGLIDDRILDINTLMLDVLEDRNLKKFDTVINDVKITKFYDGCCRSCLKFNDTIGYGLNNQGIQSKVEVISYMHAAILNPDTLYYNDSIFIPKYSSKNYQPRLLALVKIHDIASKYTIPIKIGDTILIEISDVYNVNINTGYVAMWEPGQEIKQKQYWSRGPSSAHFNQKEIEFNRYYSALMDVEVYSDVYRITTEEEIAHHTFRVLHCRGFIYFEENTLFKTQTTNEKRVQNEIFKKLFNEN